MKNKNIKISALILICLLLIFVILKKNLIKRNLYYLSDSYPEIYNKFLHLVLDNDIVFSDDEINNLFNSIFFYSNNQDFHKPHLSARDYLHYNQKVQLLFQFQLSLFSQNYILL